MSTMSAKWFAQSVSASSTSATVVDLESGSISQSIAAPLPARTHASRAAIITEDIRTDLVDDFFGSSKPVLSATHESRHNRRSVHSSAPPAYVGEDLPAYSEVVEEPATMAMYLFKYGFLFPPFWIFGAAVLLTPLRAPADWEPTKTEEERSLAVKEMRAVEVKWGKRSAIALAILVVLLSVIAVGVWAASR